MAKCVGCDRTDGKHDKGCPEVELDELTKKAKGRRFTPAEQKRAEVLTKRIGANIGPW
jgi:hypothetical protein